MIASKTVTACDNLRGAMCRATPLQQRCSVTPLTAIQAARDKAEHAIDTSADLRCCEHAPRYCRKLPICAFKNRNVAGISSRPPTISKLSKRCIAQCNHIDTAHRSHILGRVLLVSGTVVKPHIQTPLAAALRRAPRQRHAAPSISECGE